jgi:hypothetical protein
VEVSPKIVLARRKAELARIPPKPLPPDPAIVMPVQRPVPAKAPASPPNKPVAAPGKAPTPVVKAIPPVAPAKEIKGLPAKIASKEVPARKTASTKTSEVVQAKVVVRQASREIDVTPARPPARTSGFFVTIFRGILCSILATVIVNFANIKHGVVYVCNLVTAVSDPDPEILEAKERFKGILKKAEEKVDKAEKEVETAKKESDKSKPPEGQHKPGILAKLPLADVKAKAEQAAAPAKEAVEKAKEDVKEAKDKVSTTATKVTDTVDKLSAASKVANKIDTMKEDHAAAVEAKRIEAEKIQRELLIAHATKIGMKVDEGWSNERLRIEVGDAVALQEAKKQVAYLAWWGRVGPNGKCPMCRFPMHVSSRGHGNVGCPNARCGANFTSSQVRLQGAPMPPRPYDPRFTVWWEAQSKSQAKNEHKDKP